MSTATDTTLATAAIAYPSKIANMPADVYHARPEWSHSQRKLLPREPELFCGYHVTKEWEFKQTDDMWLGECLHAVQLEHKPLVEIPEYALTSTGQRRGNAWKAWEAEHADDFYLLKKDCGRVRAMADGLRADPKCRALLDAEGECEISCFYGDPRTGLELRARIDKLARFSGLRIIGDIKATNVDVCNARMIGAKVVEFGYHRQAAGYLDAVEAVEGAMPDGFAFLFVRNKPPYNARLWTPPADVLDLGRQQNRAALDDLSRRLASGDWNETSTFGRENVIQLPRYAFEGDAFGGDVAPYAEFSQFNSEE